MLDIVVIDNYDSFTWNIVEYLSALTERQIDVYRNDKITIETLKSLSPKLLVISPGPGHPETDAGISSDAISEFAGKIPILGVCMGQQCIFTVFGGKVEETGEILHGKTSLVRHDGKGLYVGVPQDIPVTRYHSLAGTKSTLPDCLELTCWTESGVIMGIRHKEYAIEGVQYHPESILSEGGKMMLGNFLKLKGGTWIENDEAAKPSACTIPPKTNGKKSKTILETIHEQRLKDIAVSKTIPGSTGRDLETFLSLNLAPPLIDFPTRLRQNRPAPGVMAEIKRASPSKGDIDIQANAAQQATLYARGGASVISVLTEPKWFKGSLADLRAARDAVDTMPNRPALLRKDFIVDPYQIMEARAYGADTVLLIVAMLSEAQLTELYNYSKSLSMEPLVEVNNAEEMKIALKLGAKVIGVNNRNLHDFVVDLDTTSRLAEGLSSEVTLCALSGITGRKDVEKYTSEGVGAVLVGEALMRASDKGKFIDGLLGVNSANGAKGILPLPLVKICGTRTSEGALAAAEAGADFIGLIFARGRKRTITTEQARKIVSDVRTRFPASSSNETVPEQVPKTWFGYHAKAFATHPKKPLFVGVFQDQSLQEILEIQASVPLDIVQLHGSEPLEWARLIPCRVFKAFDLTEPALAKPGYHALPILDATSTDGTKGGTGTRLDTEAVRRYISTTRVPAILAGGLTPDNVAEFIFSTPCIGVDVSSGVERDGKQDIQLIKRFVANAKNARRSETVQDLDY